jgi:hypothetical protein
MIDVAAALPAIVTQAAQRTQLSEKGVVGVRVHRLFDVHAGPYSRHDDMQFAAVYQDGVLIRMRITYQRVGGKDTDAATKSQTQQKYEHPAPGDVFDRPYDARYVNDYDYDLADPHTVRFRAKVRDAGHGDGTFTVDGDANVVSVQYSPCTMPQYAKSGTVTDQRAQVLPKYWALTQEVQEYHGRYAIFSGGATATITQGPFIRFPDVATAVAALEAGRI